MIYGIAKVRQTGVLQTGCSAGLRPKYLDVKARASPTGTQATEWLRVRASRTSIALRRIRRAGGAWQIDAVVEKFTSNTSLSPPPPSAVSRVPAHDLREYPEETGDFRYDPLDGDLKLMPDLSTLSVVPWESDPTAQVICDMMNTKGDPGVLPPRKRAQDGGQALHRRRSWKPVGGAGNRILPGRQSAIRTTRCSRPGAFGTQITGCQSYSSPVVNEFDELVDDIYDFSDKQGLEIDTLIP